MLKVLEHPSLLSYPDPGTALAQGHFHLQPGPDWHYPEDRGTASDGGGFGTVMHLCEYVGVTIVVIGCIPILVDWSPFVDVNRLLFELNQHRGKT